jgi:large subunit ribosomal protein L9
MHVILKQDVAKLGHKDDIVKVKNGYGTNFLIPKGYAIIATDAAKKVHSENMRQRAHKEEKIREDATAMAKKLENAVLKIAAKTSSTGKIFGSVNTIQIAEAITQKGFAVDRKNITIFDEENIKEVGTYKARIKLHKEITVDITFEVYTE